MTEAQRKQFFEIRRLMDKLVAAIPMSDETEFNASASAINENAAAIARAIRNDCQPRAISCCDESATDKNQAIMTTPFFVHWSMRSARDQRRTPFITFNL